MTVHESGPVSTGWRGRLTQPLAPQARARIRLSIALFPIIALAVTSWALFVYDNGVAGRLDRAGHIKGHDFVHFYVLGQIARDRAPGDLYSFSAQSARTDRLLPEYPSRFLPVHAPQVAMFFAPFAALRYDRAVIGWLAVSLVIYAASCRLIWSRLPALRGYGITAALLCASFPPLFAVMVAGQTSVLALGWFALGYLALRAKRPWLAGLVFGTLAYKPTLGLAVACVFVAARDVRVIAGALAAAGVQFALAAAYFGPAAVTGYVANFNAVVASVPLLESRLDIMHSLRSFFAVLLPWPAAAAIAYAAASVVVLAFVIRIWRSGAALELRYGALMLATVLVNPHVYSYELVVLAVAFLLLAAWALEGRRAAGLWVLLLACYLLPALDPVMSGTRIQWSVIAMTLLMVVLWRASATEPRQVAAEAR